MSKRKLNKFLKALDAVKQDYTCDFCNKLFVNPVTLDSCYHLICSKHFKILSACPTCNIPLVNCKVITDENLGVCVNSAKQLCDIFETFRTKDILQESNDSFAVPGKERSMQNWPSTSANISAKEDRSATKTSTKRNSKVNQMIKYDNHNTIMPSTSSFKINKGIQKRNTKGETALHVACRLGKVDSVIDLLKQAANTNTKDNAGWTPLHEVVQNGRLDLVKILLQYNTLIDVPGQSNETPLHEAVRYNYKDIAKELVRNGADLNARNCKGETPMALASNEMKEVLNAAAENVIQTQGINITYISELYIELDLEDIRVYCISQSRTVHNQLKLLSKHHSNVHIEAKLTKKVTHMVVDEKDGVCTSSLDVLQGVVYSIWIVSSQWVTKSTKQTLEPFKDYEVEGIGNKSYQGPKNARYNKYRQLPGIFNGCHFYLHNFNVQYEISTSLVVMKAKLSKLIVDAGGIVLRRVPNPELIPEAERLVPYHAKKGGKLVECSHYIIFKDMYQPMYNMSHIKALPIGWLIECLEKYELCDSW